jgi:hypothetical protein
MQARARTQRSKRGQFTARRRQPFGHAGGGLRKKRDIELLEARQVLASVFWNVDADGLWDVANNWRDETGASRLPAAGDDVFLARPGGPFTITYGSGATTIRSLHTGNSGFALTGGSLRVSAASEINANFTFSGGSLIPDGVQILLSGNSTWTGGAVYGGAGSPAPPAFGASGLRNTGQLTLAGANLKFLGGVLDNAGTVTHTGSGALHLEVLENFGVSGWLGTVNNLAGGVYDLQADTAFSALRKLSNAGTFRKSVGAGALTLRPFTNLGGTVDVRAGTLTIDGTAGDGKAPTWTGGDFTVSQNAVLEWVGENSFQRYDLTGNYSGSGQGTVRFVAGRLNFAGAGSSLNFTPELFQWSGSSPTEIDGGTAGVTNLGSLTLTGDGEKRLSHALTNVGTISHGGTGNLVRLNGGDLSNLAGATYEFTSDADLATNSFINRGTLRKSGGAGASSIDSLTLSNENGTIDVRSGTLELLSRSGANTGGTFNVSTGAVLDLTPTCCSSVLMRYAGVYTGSGAGAVRLANSAIVADAAGATFNFPPGMFQWTGGALVGGTAGINNVGSITLSGANAKTLSGVLNNAGTIIHSGSGNLSVGTLNNLPSGVYDLQGDMQLVRTGGEGNLFNNFGLFRK